MSQKLLILGATGFIGRNMVEYFAQKPEFDVTAVHFTRPPFPCENVTWKKADLTKEDQVNALLEGVDIVIQAAAVTSGAKDIVTRPYIHVTDNAVMNSLLLRAAFEHKIKHFLFFSCTVMYPSSETALVEEDFDANKPLNQRYFGVGWTKVYTEKMCEFYAGISSMKTTAIRHSNIYGPHDKYDLERSHVFGATVTKVMEADDPGKINVWGTGEEERDLLHVTDLCHFVDAAIEKQPEGFKLYNCGLGEAIPIKDLVKKIIDHSGKDVAMEHDLSKPTIKTSLFLNCYKAKKELGWSPRISLDDGIKDAISWWRDNIGSSDKKKYG